MKKYLVNFILLFFLPVSAIHAEGPTYKVIGENQHWQGTVELQQAVLVAAGAELRIAPGTVIRPLQPEFELRIEGALSAIGTAQQPIDFSAPAGWRGVVLAQSARQSRFEHVSFSGAETAISSTMSRFAVKQSRFHDCETAINLQRQSSPVVDGSDFTGNRIAIDIEMRSQVVLQNNRFADNETAILASHNSGGVVRKNEFVNNRTGVQLQHMFVGELTENRFTENATAVLCDQTLESPQILNNSFSGNQQAIISLLASKPLIHGNRFTGNQQALVNNQLGSPRVEQNLFSDNGIAITSERRSAPLVVRNQFAKNRLALLCDYLSYPKVRQNNFIGNRLAVKLGDYQSADKEKQGLVQGEVNQFLQTSGRQGKHASFTAAPGTVDLRDNWWGQADNPDSADLRSALFFDRVDSQWVTDVASGQRFLRDLVRYSPWLSEPVEHAGVK